jgi:hypothetical protein
MSNSSPRPSNTNELFKQVLKQGTLLGAAIATFGISIGFLVAGEAGAASALIGAAIAIVFNGMTALSVWIGGKLPLAGFYGVVLGGWIFKVVIFIVIIAFLRRAEFIDGPTLFFTLVASILGGLAIDAVAVLRARIPVVDY